MVVVGLGVALVVLGDGDGVSEGDGVGEGVGDSVGDSVGVGVATGDAVATDAQPVNVQASQQLGNEPMHAVPPRGVRHCPASRLM